MSKKIKFVWMLFDQIDGTDGIVSLKNLGKMIFLN